MKFERRNVILAAVLAGLIGIDFSLARSSSSSRAIEVLYPALSATRATRIVMEHPAAGGGEPQRLEIEKLGDVWVLPGFHGYPARKAMVQALFDRLIAMTNIDLLAAEASTHAGYGVDDSGFVLIVTDADGEQIAGLIQGGAAAAVKAGAPAATYVRLVGDDRVFRAPRFGTLSIDPRLWLDARFLRFAPSGVTAITLSGSACAGSLRLARQDATNWRDASDGSSVHAPAVADFLDFLQVLFFDEVLAAEAPAMEQPYLQIDLDVGLEEPLRVQFGELRADETRPARSSASSFLLNFGPDAWRPLVDRAQSLAGKGE